MDKKLSNTFKTTKVTKLAKANLKRVLQTSLFLNFCKKFEEKHVSGYILLTEQILKLTGCLYFVKYWAICVLQFCGPGSEIINFEISRFSLIKPFFVHDQKFKTKDLNILKTEKAFKMK